jgi:hypothetical protein
LDLPKPHSCPLPLGATITKVSTLPTDLLFVTAIHETDSTFVTRLVMGRMIECEMVETIRCAPSALKASKIAMDGVLSNLVRASVPKVLSASMAVWVWIGTEMIGDSRIGKTVM